MMLRHEISTLIAIQPVRILQDISKTMAHKSIACA